MQNLDASFLFDTLTLNVLERGRVHDSVKAKARALESKPALEQANFLNSKTPPKVQLTEKPRFNNQNILQNRSTDFSIGKGRQSKLDSSVVQIVDVNTLIATYVKRLRRLALRAKKPIILLMFVCLLKQLRHLALKALNRDFNKTVEVTKIRKNLAEMAM